MLFEKVRGYFRRLTYRRAEVRSGRE